MKLYLTFIIVCFFSKGYSQDFGCFNEPSFGSESVFSLNSTQVNYDSLLWIPYKLPSTNDGYYKAMWNKYQIKMEGNIINGMRNGLWRIFLKNENIYYQGNFIDDKKEGEWKRFEIYSNDTILRMDGFYKNNLREGKFISYGRDTVIYEISNYKAGKLDGEYIYYSFLRSNKKHLDMVINYKDDKKNGLEKEYKLDDKGKLYLYGISEYLNDERVGKSFEFSCKGDTLSMTDDNGFLQYEQRMVGKKLLLDYSKKNDTIIHIDYSDNGDTTKFEISTHDKYFGKIYLQDTLDKKWKIDKALNYIDGLTDGIYKKYFSNGQLAYEIQLKKGLLYTAVCAFTKDGRKLDIGTLKNGNGTLKIYFPDGNLKSSFTYHNSTCQGSICSYYKNENLEIVGIMYSNKPSAIELSSYTDDDLNKNNLKNNLFGDIKCYHENGTSMSTIRYDTINKITSYEYFFMNGNPSCSFFKINKKETGEYATFYENGKLEVVGKYKITKDSNSVKDSIWTYYFKEGNLRASISYNEGRKTGQSRYYDKTGKLRRVEIIEDDGTLYNIFDSDTVNYTDKNGLKQGKWVSFPYSFLNNEEFCNDTPDNTEYYKDGHPVGVWEKTQRFYDETEKYIWTDSTLAYCYIYNKKNQRVAEGDIIYPEFMFGLWKEYDKSEGYLKAEGQYYFSTKVGSWKIFKKNGKVKEVIDYNKNRKNKAT